MVKRTNIPPPRRHSKVQNIFSIPSFSWQPSVSLFFSCSPSQKSCSWRAKTIHALKGYPMKYPTKQLCFGNDEQGQLLCMHFWTKVDRFYTACTTQQRTWEERPRRFHFCVFLILSSLILIIKTDINVFWVATSSFYMCNGFNVDNLENTEKWDFCKFENLCRWMYRKWFDLLGSDSFLASP